MMTLKLGKQAGAAILLAMLTVSLVAMFAAGAFWHQWREIEMESAERSRFQSAWILVGARDWARAILRDDARTSTSDHLAEPWAMPQREMPLSTFLQASSGTNNESSDSTLALQVSDLQAKLNLRNVLEGGPASDTDRQSLIKLFGLLNLDKQQLELLIQRMPSRGGIRASTAGPASSALSPQSMNQLVWFGLSPSTIAALKPYATLLPERTPVNINTASAIVICASIEDLDMSGAERLVSSRVQSPFRSLNEAGKALGDQGAELNEGRFSIASRFFELNSRLRLQDSIVQEQVVLQREKTDVKVLRREPVVAGS